MKNLPMLEKRAEIYKVDMVDDLIHDMNRDLRGTKFEGVASALLEIMEDLLIEPDRPDMYAEEKRHVVPLAILAEKLKLSLLESVREEAWERVRNEEEARRSV